MLLASGQIGQLVLIEFPPLPCTKAKTFFISLPILTHQIIAIQPPHGILIIIPLHSIPLLHHLLQTSCRILLLLIILLANPRLILKGGTIYPLIHPLVIIPNPSRVVSLMFCVFEWKGWCEYNRGL